jgi:hypothetical protein
LRSDRRKNAGRLLLEGRSPTQIAAELHFSLGMVLNFLYHEVGLGRLRRSDILFSIDPMMRHAVEQAIAQSGSTVPGKVRRALERAGLQVPRGDLNVYLHLRDSRVDLGDMYEFIREVELRLHTLVQEALIAQYGKGEWWRKGVPLHVREDCALTNERDSEPVASLYCYTTVMHLRQIFDREWPTLSRNLPGQIRADKSEFLASLTRLNRIRNVVMHPVKGILLNENDFDFVRRLRWQLLQAEKIAEQAQPEQRAADDTDVSAAGKEPLVRGINVTQR